jgi:hypothetical protein
MSVVASVTGKDFRHFSKSSQTHTDIICSITNTTRYWGQGVAGYGNNIKDASRAGGPRVPTGGNPLGLSGAGSSKTLMPGGKLPPGSQQRNAGKGSAKNPLGL